MGHAEKGIIDYASVMRGISTETREKLFNNLLKGSGQDNPNAPTIPGLEQQFVETLVEYRAFADMVVARKGYLASDHGLKGELLATAENDLASMLYALYTKKERLEALGNELGRIQAALAEIKNAGTET